MVSRADVLHWLRQGWNADQSLADAIAVGDCVVGYADELTGELADRMDETDTGRVPILRRGDDVVIGLVARRDLLRVRSSAVRHERDREALIDLRKSLRREVG